MSKQPKKPFHAGEILLEEFLIPMRDTQVVFAEKLGWTKARLNKLINVFDLQKLLGHTKIDMTMR